MISVSRISLQPTAKRTFTKLWLAVAVAMLATGAYACSNMPASVTVEVLKNGAGISPTEADVVTINYKGKLTNGKVFNETMGARLPMQGIIIPGFIEALEQMKQGGKYKVVIPYQKAYGKKGAPGIAPNSDLEFEIELINIQSRAQIEAEMQAERMKTIEDVPPAEQSGRKGG